MKKNSLFLLLLISIAEGFAALIATFSIPTNTENPILFGFSLGRLLLLSLVCFLLLGVLILLLNRSKAERLLSTWSTSTRANQVVTAVGLTAFVLLWVTLSTPTQDLLDYEGLFVRSKPLLIWVEVFFLQAALWVKLQNKTFGMPNKQPLLTPKSIALVFLPLLAFWVVISITKVGLVSDTAYWNVPGIPLNLIQFLGILLFLCLGFIFAPQTPAQTSHGSKWMMFLIPAAIYLVTVLLWGLTPMLKHYFSLAPTPPNLQPFPWSDARYNDLGGLSVLLGKGIYFHGFTDKPFYMAFLAILHAFSGNDYTLTQLAQILVLALAPVCLYLFGKRQYGTLFGITAAAMMMFQQRNAIVLSHKIASVNPKLLMSENLTLLGMVLVTWLLFLWMRTAEPKKIFLLGGLVGALSLVRVNPIFIAPVVLLIILVRFRKSPKLLWKQVALLGLGFLIVFSPWLVTGVNPEGESWFLIKIRNVIETRYRPQSSVPQSPDAAREVASISPNYHFTQQTANPTQSNEYGETGSVAPAQGGPNNLAWMMFNHFAHNISGSLLILPDTLRVTSLGDLSLREYWQDNNEWDGNFPPGQYVLILVNLFVVSLGLLVSWKKYRWAGLAPLIVFLAYDLSLAVASNSGSRYIVPISWIVFVYYGLGLIQLVRFLLGFVGIQISPDLNATVPEKAPTAERRWLSWLPVTAVLLVLAAILPIANQPQPVWTPSPAVPQQLLAYAKANEPAELQLVNATLLYPYYQLDGNISFDLLRGSRVSQHVIPQSYLTSPEETVLESGLPVLLSIIKSDSTFDVKSIYALQDGSPRLIWHKD